jgi:signal peptidase I
VDFGAAAVYEPPALPKPTDNDLVPVGIAAQGATVTVSHLLLQRDIYYRSEYVIDDNDFGSMPRSKEEYGAYTKEHLNSLLSRPDEWYEEYKSHSEPPAVFAELGPDEFFVMGDNSPRSKDSRLWSNVRRAEHRHAVPRSALVGKAFFVYWPHGVPFLNDGHGIPIWNHRTQRGETTDYPSVRVPFYPQVDRMTRIR